MIKSSIEKLAREIGHDIGASDDVTQANLLNGFCEGLNNSIRDKANLETQICYISKKLTSKSKKILSEIVEFNKLQDNE